MKIVVSWHVEGEEDTRELTSEDLPIEDIEVIFDSEGVSEVIEEFEGRGIMIDQGGSDNTTEYDLPDTFEDVGEGEKTATELFNKIVEIFRVG